MEGAMSSRSTLASRLLALAVLVAVSSLAASPHVLSQTGAFVTLTSPLDSGVSGQTLIHENGADRWMVMVTLQGLEPNSRYAAHIRSGSCSGVILFQLEDMLADANGTSHSETNVAAAPNATWWIEIGGAANPSGLHVACGQVPAR